jgi:hypothetical protein
VPRSGSGTGWGAGWGARLRRHGLRVAITVAGFGVVLAGVAMLVLPGPGLVTIALGFGLLGREYTWAARIDQAVRRRVAEAGRKVLAARQGDRPTVVPAPSVERPRDVQPAAEAA